MACHSAGLGSSVPHRRATEMRWWPGPGCCRPAAARLPRRKPPERPSPLRKLTIFFGSCYCSLRIRLFLSRCGYRGAAGVSLRCSPILWCAGLLPLWAVRRRFSSLRGWIRISGAAFPRAASGGQRGGYGSLKQCRSRAHDERRRPAYLNQGWIYNNSHFEMQYQKIYKLIYGINFTGTMRYAKQRLPAQGFSYAPRILRLYPAI